jgi:DNA-binding PadR family transcriptional regulator
MAGKLKPLTPRDVDVLRALDVAPTTVSSLEGWLTPYYCGGWDASHHSATLRKLVRHGLAEKKPRGGWSRGSLIYRITEQGRQRLRKERHRVRS